jgi:putative ABC transport system ATP-binding protein
MTATPADGARRADAARLADGAGRAGGVSAASGLSELGAEAERARTSYGEGAVIMCDRLVRIFAADGIEVQALQGLDLLVEDGELTAVVGASGSGKSTLMNIIGCLDVATSGRYLLDGVDVRSMDEDALSDLRSRKIGFIFQSFNLVARTTALANVEMPLAYAGVPRADRRTRALAALAAVGMTDRAGHRPSELSGGQQQRVAIARAIVTNPPLILADEPTGNLDSRSSDEVLGIFERLNREGRTVVLITHEPEVAERTRRVVRLSDGLVSSDELTGAVA